MTVLKMNLETPSNWRVIEIRILPGSTLVHVTLSWRDPQNTMDTREITADTREITACDPQNMMAREITAYTREITACFLCLETRELIGLIVDVGMSSTDLAAQIITAIGNELHLNDPDVCEVEIPEAACHVFAGVSLYRDGTIVVRYCQSTRLQDVTIVTPAGLFKQPWHPVDQITLGFAIHAVPIKKSSN